jgi:predicted Zn-dependent peptidase
MTVVLQEDHRTPVVSMNLRYEGGEAVLPTGLKGTAALTTFLMLQATKHVPSGDYYRLLARAGATNVTDSTWEAGIALRLQVPSNQVALPLWMWSDQMAFFDDALDDGLLQMKRNQLREQMRTDLEGSPTARLDLFAAEELYPPEHPYHHETTPDDFVAIGRPEVLAYHDAWITPEHATLVIVGDIAAAEGFALVERYFGGLPSKNNGRMMRPKPVILPGEIKVQVAANTPHAQISIRWPTPRILTMEDGRLDIVAQYLDGWGASWLRWRLVDAKHVAVKATARQRSRELGSQFQIDIEGAPGKTADELLAAFDAAFDEIASRTPRPHEIMNGEYEFVRRWFDYERPGYRASEYAKYATLVGDADWTNHDLERYRDITPDALVSAMRTWLPRERRVVLLVSPKQTALAGGQRTGRTVVDAAAP